MEKNPNKRANSLISQSSPYLLQHAYNPVDWLPFSPEVFERAKAENKPLLISIGYSACHWCHVMERESFEDESVAAVMNRNFINVKVDREERSDVDMLYMQAVQLMTGHGGWPLNCFVLPDGRPFYGGTYFPKAQWTNILERLSELFKNERPKVEAYANELTNGIQRAENIFSGKEPQGEISKDLLKSCVSKWRRSLDNEEGGPNHAPKFPLPSNYQFLLRYAVLEKDGALLNHVDLTLRKMAFGGIHDQVHGGFCRYSTDMIWKVPHFEKMLYDNAQLASLYLEAHLLLNNSYYLQVAESILQFVSKEWLDREGYFYSAYDADSEGLEGKYYVWSVEELRHVLAEDFAVFEEYFHIDEKGYWEDGNYILMRREGLVPSNERIAACLDKLRIAAASRVKPGLDDKCIASWNAMMCTAFARAFVVTGNPEYRKTALQNLDFILERMRSPEGKLFRTYKGGKARIEAFLDDYAFLSEACMSVYLATGREDLLEEAKRVCGTALTSFSNSGSAMLYYTDNEGEQLVARTTECFDNVIPSSNAQMAHNLFALSRYFELPEWEQRAASMLNAMSSEIRDHGSSFSHWASLALQFAYPFREIALVGKNVDEKLRALVSHGITNAIFAFSDTSSEIPLLKDRYIPGQSLIYVCRNKTCGLPVSTVEEALEQLA